LVEALSALRRLVRLGELSGREGEEAVDWLRAMDLVLDATGPRARRIWELREAMSAYDAAYAAAAEVFAVPLVTVDQRLRRACRAAGIDAISLDNLTGP
jgi:predicted nucleic acid-binding protein